MTDNITLFPGTKSNDTPLDKIMLICGNCRCETFHLLANGTMACAYCDTPVSADSENAWRERMPEFDEAGMENVDPPVHNKFLGSAEFARKRVMRDLNHWSDTGTTALVIGYNVDGMGQSWVDIDTEQQREWVMEKIGQLLAYVGEMDISSTRTVVYVPEEENGNEENVEEASGEGAAEESAQGTDEGGADGSGDAP